MKSLAELGNAVLESTSRFLDAEAAVVLNDMQSVLAGVDSTRAKTSRKDWDSAHKALQKARFQLQRDVKAADAGATMFLNLDREDTEAQWLKQLVLRANVVMGK